jgi:hypothetical protein
MPNRCILFLAACMALYAQAPKPVIDNDRVTVWDVKWTKGTLDPSRGRELDTVVLWTAGPKVRTASFIPKDKVHDESAPDGSRSLIIELKDHPMEPYPNPAHYPLAFPRPHVKKLLENNRMVVWSYRWNPGEPTPMHFHDKDVVVVYLEDTALTSTTPDGKKTANQYKAFDVKFNKGNRTHTELLDHGSGSAMMMELK